MSNSSTDTLEDNTLHGVKSIQEITPTEQDKTVQTIVDLVKISIEDEKLNNKIKIELTPEVKNILVKMISITPNTLVDLEKATIEIIKDGKIDSKDIPNLVIVIQQIYQFIYSLKNGKLDANKIADVTSNSLKYFIHLLVLLDKIKIKEENIDSYLTQIYTLIDSCIGLLTYSKSIKTKGCLKKIFG
jgi:hypothetical protein